jgi:DNA-directed RNA polymerase subunit E"
MARENACRKCRGLSSGKACPICGSTDLSSEWTGLIIILDPEKSEVSKSLSIVKPGRYALKVN